MKAGQVKKSLSKKYIKGIYNSALFFTLAISAPILKTPLPQPLSIQDALSPEQNKQNIPEDVKTEIIKLNSSFSAERMKAIRALDKMGSHAAPAVPYLIRALKENPLTRERITDALDKIEPKWKSSSFADEEIPVLIQMLKEDSTKERAYRALEAIDLNWGERSVAKSAVPDIIALLGDDSELARVNGIWILVEIADKRGIKPLFKLLDDKNENVAKYAIWALSHIGDDGAVAPLIKILKEGDESKLRELSNAFGRLGAVATSPLKSVLNDKNEIVRQGAARGLGQIGSVTAIEPLFKLLRDSNETVRDIAVWYLTEGIINDNARIKLLESAQKSPDNQVSEVASIALESIEKAKLRRKMSGKRILEVTGKVPNRRVDIPLYWPDAKLAKRAVPGLIAALKDKDSLVVERAIKALSIIRDERAVEPLIDLIKYQKRDYICDYSAKALADIGAPSIKPLVLALNNKNVKNHGYIALALMMMKDHGAFEPLIDLLTDQDFELRVSAADALLLLNSDLIKGEEFSRLLPKFVSMLNGNIHAVRIRIIELLGRSGDPRAVEPIIASLSDMITVVREKAVAALGAILDTRAVEPAIKLLATDDSFEVRVKSAETLSRFGDPRSIGALFDALSDRDARVRYVCAEYLNLLGWKPENPDDEILHMFSATKWDALIEKGELAVDILIAGLKDDMRKIKEKSASALGKIKSPRAVKPLIALLQDKSWDVRWFAAIALGEVGDPRAVKPLKELSENDPNRDVRRISENAYNMIIKNTNESTKESNK